MLQAKCPTCGDRVTCSDPLFSFHVPVVIRHIEDYGEQTSDKEAEFISETIASFLNKGVPAGEIAVLSPFRAQAANIRRHLRRHAGLPEDVASAVTSDTVDKMQGQEREVIIFSLTAGNPDYMTEMAEFLYKPNKMNVAFSRAKFKLIIVGNIEEIRKMDLEEFSYLKRMLESKYAKVME
jgi:superfamily I DNA and/or RNA helicase